MDDKDLAAFQKELAKRLGLRKHKRYPEALTRILLRNYEFHVNNAYMNGDWEDVLPAARDLYTGWDAHAAQESDSGWTGVSERAAEQIGDDAVKRSRVFSEYLAKLAAPEDAIIRQSTDGPVPVYPEIKGFRVKCLGDKLLTPRQAWALLTSPVAAHWRRFVFKKLRVPVVGHAYQVTEGMNDKRSPYSLVEVPLPSSKVEAIKDRRPLPAGVWELPEKREKARSNKRLKRELEAPGGSWKIVQYPGEDGRTHRVLVKQRSVLGELYDIVSRLIQRYPWEEPDAVWFVLTGETPQVAPLTWQARWFGDDVGDDSFSYGFVTLKIEPWVDAKLVWKVLVDIQRGLRNGRRNRRLEPKSLELLRFVNERVNVADLSRAERRRLAPELVAAWDKEYPDDSYDGNTREFWKAYDRVRRAVMSPTYEWREDYSHP